MKTIRLEGSNGLKTYSISIDTADEQGNFNLSYTRNDYGIGNLICPDGKSFSLILSKEGARVLGEDLANISAIKVLGSAENKWFEQYAQESPRREQALSAWTYLDRLYQSDTLFSRQHQLRQTMTTEYKRIIIQDSVFLASLPPDSYAARYLPLRKFVSSISIVAQYRTQEIPQYIENFRKLDFASNDFYKSGLLKNLIDSHFWLLENARIHQEALQKELQLSIDAMLKSLSRDEKKLNELSQYLFQAFESRNQVLASEYLALKLLNETGCTIDGDFARQLESYRFMKPGKIAPPITFVATTRSPGYAKAPLSLTDIKNNYILLVFGASWCPQCAKEIPAITNFYPAWKQKDIEVVFVSLDTEKNAFETFAKDFPFISTCDFKKWDGEIAKSYFIFATPTFFLLDKNRKIISRPNSLEQVATWIDAGMK